MDNASTGVPHLRRNQPVKGVSRGILAELHGRKNFTTAVDAV